MVNGNIVGWLIPAGLGSDRKLCPFSHVTVMISSMSQVGLLARISLLHVVIFAGFAAVCERGRTFPFCGQTSALQLIGLEQHSGCAQPKHGKKCERGVLNNSKVVC